MSEPHRNKVLIVAHPNYGIAHYSYSLARALADLESRQEDIMLAINKGFSCEQVPNLDIVKIFSRTRNLPQELIHVLTLIVRERVDLVHFQNPLKYPFLTWWVILFTRWAGAKAVYTAHDVLPHYARSYHRWLMRRIYQSSDCVITHSEDNRRSIQSLAGGKVKIEVISHGIYDIFREGEAVSQLEARNRLDIPKDSMVLLFFGRMDERKGAQIIVRELPKLYERDQRVHLLMAGSTNYKLGYLKEIAEKEGIGGALSIIEDWIPDEDVKIYFTAADAVVLPYVEGSTSGVIKVALAFGKKVIATRVGELPEIIEKTRAGLLVDFPLSEDNIVRILSLLEDQAAGGHDLASDGSEEYSWQNIATHTERLYRLILGAQASKAN